MPYSKQTYKNMVINLKNKNMLFQATVGEIHRITEYNSFCMESQFWFSQSVAKTSSWDKFKVSHIDV